MKSQIALTISGIILIASPAFAQADNVGHEHHLHKHNDPHPRGVVESRFHTTREGLDLPLPMEEDAFVFGIFGDRTGGPADGVSVLADAVHDINLFEPDLVMTVGDLVNGYNATPQWMVQVREYKGIMDELLCPWFPVAGNHDVYWRGPNSPAGQHEQNYEMHFGPLWYAFEHKNSWFIALYSDEGNPDTGEKTFHKPEAQRMSDEQFEWLSSILEQASDADHVFLFLHHPRWRGGNYGDDWERVHQLLVDAGNVTAVFSGHIHRMTSAPRDGIEYITLATVGGGQAGHVPKAGWLHHYNLITVRKNQVAIAAIPVGKVLDPREITFDLSDETASLTRMSLALNKPIRFEDDNSVDQVVTVTLKNPTGRSVDVTVVPESKDSRWIFSPDHLHGTMAPNSEFVKEFSVLRGSDAIDSTFRPPKATISMDYLADGFRYPIPKQTQFLEIDIASMNLKPSVEDLVLQLDGKDDVLRVRSADISIPEDSPLTLEAWFQGDGFSGRTGLITKTENSEYGLFATDGKPTFSVHLAGKYVNASGRKGSLVPNRLYHIAGVFDGQEVRLYIDGKLISSTRGSGKRTKNDLDLMIGGDVNGDNMATSTFNGRVYQVRLSKSARYSGDAFSPNTDIAADSDAVFATNMDTRLGKWVINDASENDYGVLEGNAELVPVGME